MYFAPKFRVSSGGILDGVPFNIRPATAELVDSHALARFAARTFPDACPPSLSKADIDRFIEVELSAAQFAGWIENPNARVLVAGNDDLSVITGYALSLHGLHAEGPEHLRAERTAYLSKLYVDETQRGSGLARALFDAALDAARNDGCSALWLGVNDENARARAFYEKSGLEAAGKREFTVGAQTFTDDIFAIGLE